MMVCGARLLLACFLTLALVACTEASPRLEVEANAKAGGIDLGAIWSNCGNNASDMSIIKNVTITPNPPSKKKPVTINAWFTLKENITGGSFTAKVKYGFLPTVTQTLQVCDLVKMAGLKCPIPKTTNHILITQKIPSFFPAGHYKGQVVGVDQNGKRLGCINIDVHI